MISVEVVEDGHAETGVAGLTYYVEPGRAGPSFLIEDILADWWGASVGGLGRPRSEAENPYDRDPAPLLPVVELAVLDAVGRQTGLPAAAFLGGVRSERLPAYASLPSFSAPEDAVTCAAAAVEAGFRAVKFHASGFVDLDLETIRAARQALGSSLPLMWDASCAYRLDAAETIGSALSEARFLWFEAPLADDATAALRRLAERVAVPLVPDGMVERSPAEWARDVEDGIWGALRGDVTRARSLRGTLALSYLAESLGFPFEIQSFGFPLSQFANLQLMLGTPSCRYFEAPFPRADLDDDLVPPPVIEDGCVLAPTEAGLGHGLDLDRLAQTAQLLTRVPA